MRSLGFNVITTSLAIVQSSGFLASPRIAKSRSGLHCEAALHESWGRSCGDDTNAEPANLCLRTIEFYSGIGGLRLALEAAAEDADARSDYSCDITLVDCYDINMLANSVYEHNFSRASVTRCSIEHLSGQDLDGRADLWLLSPPCQPFCRVGNQMDTEDPRSRSFLHLLSLLETIALPPSHVFLENVRGFEGSKTHERLLAVLSKRRYDVEQYLLSPVQLGIPNTRLRYYCLATRRDTDTHGDVGAIRNYLPCHSAVTTTAREENEDMPLRALSDYLDPSLHGEDVTPLLLSPKAAGHANPSLRFDVVTLRSTTTTTFTKGYGKHAGRAGPVILLSDDGTRRASDEALGRFPDGLHLGPGGRELRWFSDREMLRLHGFPETYGFPPDVTIRQRWGLVGNSVNVDVVALLLSRLLFRDEAIQQQVEITGVEDVSTAVPGATKV